MVSRKQLAIGIALITVCLVIVSLPALRDEVREIQSERELSRGQELASVYCSSCHLEGKFSGVSTDCFSCHSTDFGETEDPDHEQLGFPTDCVICHGTNSETWEGAQLNHDSFVLSGQHLLADCLDCHADGVYAGRPSECVSCHLSDYQNTSDPDHELDGFPTDCTACHGTSAETWEDASFDHNSIWPLLGAHTALDFSQCHSSVT